jgi:hypothetical protein
MHWDGVAWGTEGPGYYWRDLYVHQDGTRYAVRPETESLWTTLTYPGIPDYFVVDVRTVWGDGTDWFTTGKIEHRRVGWTDPALFHNGMWVQEPAVPSRAVVIRGTSRSEVWFGQTELTPSTIEPYGGGVTVWSPTRGFRSVTTGRSAVDIWVNPNDRNDVWVAHTVDGIAYHNPNVSNVRLVKKRVGGQNVRAVWGDGAGLVWFLSYSTTDGSGHLYRSDNGSMQWMYSFPTGRPQRIWGSGPGDFWITMGQTYILHVTKGP